MSEISKLIIPENIYVLIKCCYVKCNYIQITLFGCNCVSTSKQCIYLDVDTQLHPIGIKINKIDYKLKAIGENLGETDTKPLNIRTKERFKGL